MIKLPIFNVLNIFCVDVPILFLLASCLVQYPIYLVLIARKSLHRPNFDHVSLFGCWGQKFLNFEKLCKHKLHNICLMKYYMRINFKAENFHIFHKLRRFNSKTFNNVLYEKINLINATKSFILSCLATLNFYLRAMYMVTC